MPSADLDLVVRMRRMLDRTHRVRLLLDRPARGKGPYRAGTSRELSGEPLVGRGHLKTGVGRPSR